VYFLLVVLVVVMTVQLIGLRLVSKMMYYVWSEMLNRS